MKNWPGMPGMKATGKEHCDDSKGAGDDRQADLVGAFQGRLVGTHSDVDAFFDVLDLDNGVVDQDADDEGQSQQGHHVQAETE